MSNHAHLDFPRAQPDHAGMDDVGLWSESHQPRPRMGHRSLPLAQRIHEPFGGCSCGAGHVHCNCGLFAPIEAASSCTEIGADDQTDSADAEVGAWLLKAFVVMLLALFSAWCLANYLELARVW